MPVVKEEGRGGPRTCRAYSTTVDVAKEAAAVLLDRYSSIVDSETQHPFHDRHQMETWTRIASTVRFPRFSEAAAEAAWSQGRKKMIGAI